MRHALSIRPGMSAMIAWMTLISSGCGSDGDPVPTIAAHGSPAPATIAMPAPHRSGPLSLEEALAARRSVRDFSTELLTLDALSQLLWSAQGITGAGGRGRAAPSAGGTYPLELYVVSPTGSYHYLPSDHSLEVLAERDLRPALAEAALDQQYVANAPAVVVIAAVFARTEERYGERAERYVHLEAGHAAQNILLQAVALDLGAVPVGAFHDEEVRALLDLPADHVPLYLIPVGHPAQD
jgi:SagB-type dehydrogenase family enzyme